MTVKEVAKIYSTNPIAIRQLAKHGIVTIHRVYDGYGTTFLAQNKYGTVYEVHRDYREYIDPDELDVLEMLISEIHERRNMDWERPVSLKHERPMSVEEYVSEHIYDQSEIGIILSLL